MHTAPQLFPVPFHGDTVVLVGQDNEPYVAMKPIVANMGMDWKSQHSKLAERFTSTMVEITTVAEDGKLRGMVCLPLKKLPAWLYSISPNKVAPELREKIIRYQEECDDALWNYWTQGVAERPGVAANASKQIALSRHRLTLLKELHRTRDRAMRSAIHEQLAQVSNALGLSVPALGSIGRLDSGMLPVLEKFWGAIRQLEEKGIRCNHARPGSGLVQINLPEVAKLLKENQLSVNCGPDLSDALRNSTSPRFIKTGCFRSKLLAKNIRGWTFAIDSHDQNQPPQE